MRFAVQTLREHYGLRITYQDPVITCSCDLEDLTPATRKDGFRIIMPKKRRFRFSFVEQNGAPIEGITQLLQRMAKEFASQGDTEYEVREKVLPFGTQWNVVPVQARGPGGAITKQPDLLATPLNITQEQQNAATFLHKITQQLRVASGYEVVLGTVDFNTLMGSSLLGANNVAASDALTKLYGRDGVWDIAFDAERGGRFVMNLIRTKRQPSSIAKLTSNPVAQ